MATTIDITQRATIKLDANSTVLDLIQALTENLGGEWDHAKLEPPLGALATHGEWSIGVALREDSAPARESAWASEDFEHIAKQNPDGTRTCSCRVLGTANLTDNDMAAHFNAVVGRAWTQG